MKMEEWKEYKLRDIDLEVIDGDRGKNYPHQNEFLESGFCLFLSAKNVTKSGFSFIENQYISQEKDSLLNNGKLKRGDIVITTRGTVGNVAIFSDKIPYNNIRINSGMLIIRCGKTINNFYLYHVLRSELFYNQILSIQSGSAQPQLPKSHFLNMMINLPPLPTQQKIAAILASLDDKIELNNKINTNLEQQPQALFKNWFVDKYEKEGTIGDYCAVKSGFAFKSAWWQDEGIKVIRIGDIEQGCLNLETCAHVATDKIEVAKDFIVHGGDLVIAMTGATIGKFSMIPKTQEPILVNQRVGKFFLGNNPIEKVPFIYCTLKQEEVITEFINRGQGSAQPNISTGDILTIPCWIPSKNEIDDFNKTIQPMFETIISNQEENRKLSSLRDSLLPKLMNGKIKV